MIGIELLISESNSRVVDVSGTGIGSGFCIGGEGGIGGAGGGDGTAAVGAFCKPVDAGWLTGIEIGVNELVGGFTFVGIGAGGVSGRGGVTGWLTTAVTTGSGTTGGAVAGAGATGACAA